MNFAEGSFTGKVIAITGAASGMGAACARAFAELGGTVAIIDIDEKGALGVATRDSWRRPNHWRPFHEQLLLPCNRDNH